MSKDNRNAITGEIVSMIRPERVPTYSWYTTRKESGKRNKTIRRMLVMNAITDSNIVCEVPTASSQTNNITSWKEIDWKKVERYVFRLQQRIYRAEVKGQHRKVKQLQRLLMRSKSSLLLAIKQVTVVNKGKRTAGVDGYKVIEESQRIKLYNEMKGHSIYCHNPKPARRTYIPKKNGKLRPLGIPTMKDRIYQQIAKSALEPAWEAKFESISYGFRPKRGCHDAIGAIFNKLAPGKKEWIFEGDFKGCFDNLNHDYIIEQTKDFPANNIIEKWLKAGYVDNDVFVETEAGTPQGGIISPLLANIALHGMEDELGIIYRSMTSSKTGVTNHVINDRKFKIALVRYADDFVVMCETREEAEEIYVKLKPYLAKRGLELAPDKTKITHISEGFDFLGFNIRRYSFKNNANKSKLFIMPSKRSIANFKETIAEIFRTSRGVPAGVLLKRLMPKIRGTANYWKTVVSKEIFRDMDNYIWKKTVKYLRQLHPKKSWEWKKDRYFKPDMYGISEDKWLLTDPDGKYQMVRMAWTSIERHEIIKYKNTPYDATLAEYFEKREVKEFKKNTISFYQKLAKKQNYKCPLCGMSIIDGRESFEDHHKIPRCKGGDGTIKNRILVHTSCHIEWHKIYPAKGEFVPGDKEIREFRSTKRNLYKMKNKL